METFECTNCGILPIENFPPPQGKGKLNRKRMCYGCRALSQKQRTDRYEARHPGVLKEIGKAHYHRSLKRRSRYKDDPVYRDQVNNACAKHRENNRQKINASAREKKRALRKSILEKYGHECKCCGESTYEFLAIDHVNGKGNKERKTGMKDHKLLIKLKRN